MKSMKLELVKTNNDLENGWSRARRLLAAFALGSGMLLSLAQSPQAHAQNSCTGRGCGGGSLRDGVMVDSFLIANSIRRNDPVYRTCVNPTLEQISMRLPTLGGRLSRINDSRRIVILPPEELRRMTENSNNDSFQHRISDSLLAIHVKDRPFIIADRTLYEGSRLPNSIDSRCDFIFHELVVGLLLDIGVDLSTSTGQDQVIAITAAISDLRDSEGFMSDIQLFRILDQSPSLVGLPISNLASLNLTVVDILRSAERGCQNGEFAATGTRQFGEFLDVLLHPRIRLPFGATSAQRQNEIMNIGFGIGYNLRVWHWNQPDPSTPPRGHEYPFLASCDALRSTIASDHSVITDHYTLKMGGYHVPDWSSGTLPSNGQQQGR
jgi:hypothetical protein